MKKHKTKPKVRGTKWIAGFMAATLTICSTSIPVSLQVSANSKTDIKILSENANADDNTSEQVKIDEINFPDEVFRSYLKSTYDKDNDDILKLKKLQWLDALYMEMI